MNVKHVMAMALMAGLMTVPFKVHAAADFLDARDFGVKSEVGFDSRQALQTSLDEATRQGKAVHLAAGEYEIDGDLWFASRATLVGDGESTVLRFKSGQIRTLKNNSRAFHYTSNYNNEVVPGQVESGLATTVAAGSRELVVKDASLFEAGQRVRLFNGRKDTWAILNDKKRMHLWNGAHPDALVARSENFTIASITGDQVTLNRPVTFDYPEQSTLARLVGASNVTIRDLKIVNKTDVAAIHFEQAYRPTLTNLWVEANSGIVFTHHTEGGVIEDCRIHVDKFRAINIENFSTGNIVRRNQVDYVSGGDCAILVMMSASNNQIENNVVVCRGTGFNNQGAIYIHTGCYDNRVVNNVIEGPSNPLGVYYGAFNNYLAGNKATRNRSGLTGWYAGSQNIFHNNDIDMESDRPGALATGYICGSKPLVLIGNRFTSRARIDLTLETTDEPILIDNANVTLKHVEPK